MIGSIFYSFVISQVIGLYLIIYSIIVLSRSDYYRNLVNSLELPNLALHNGAVVSLIIGVFLVDIHNIWVFKARVFVTLIAWFILLKSVLWLAIPEKMLALSKKMVSGKQFYVLIACGAVFGFILLTRGFYLYVKIQHLPVLSPGM